jgi:hypothetical protein
LQNGIIHIDHFFVKTVSETVSNKRKFASCHLQHETVSIKRVNVVAQWKHKTANETVSVKRAIVVA